MNEQTPSASGQYVNMPNYAQQPRNMRLTPRGAVSSPMSRVFPRIIAGVCEKCGVLDHSQPGQYQYKLCEHYRGQAMRCVYCNENKDHDEVIRNSTLQVREHPYRPGEILSWCGSFECVRKHEQAFKASA